ncbi:MAG: hypothetical protein AAGD96_28375 [Chloroflexota bacterium]
MSQDNEKKEEFLLSRRTLLKGLAGASAATILAACQPQAPAAPAVETSGDAAAPEASNPLMGSDASNMQGKTLTLSLAVLAGWPPSPLPIELFPKFAA